MNFKITPLFHTNAKGMDVLIIEDILDTGRTLNLLSNSVCLKDAKSIQYCCLLRKIHDRHFLRDDIKVKYIGFEIPDRFIVGYGLDYNGYFRELPDIVDIKEVYHVSH